jgi:outer membrane protein TolC
MRNILILFSLVCLSSSAFGNSFSELITRMEKSNPDLRIAGLQNEFFQKNITMAKSLHYPRLNSSWIINEGQEPDAINTSSLNLASSSAGSGGPSIPPSQIPAGSQQFSTNGWSGDLTFTLPVFTRFLAQTSVTNSKLDFQRDQLTYRISLDNKKVQLAQVLLEINSLKRIHKTLSQGLALLEKAPHNPGMAGRDSVLKREEFAYEMSYHFERVNLALQTAYMAIRDLIPDISEEELNSTLPQIEVKYPEVSLAEIQKYYMEDSREYKQLSYSAQSYENTYAQTCWEKPWIPYVMIQGSYSQSATFAKKDPSDTWRVSMLMTFNLFDGFYTETRRAQAFTAKEIMKRRSESELSKNKILITKNYYDLKAARAEYKFRKSTVERKRDKLRMLEQIGSSGVSIDFERSGLLLEISQLEWEALDAKKKEQQSLLFLAQKKDDLEGVSFDESI